MAIPKAPNGNATAWIKYLGAVSSLLLVIVIAPLGSCVGYRSIDHGQRLAVLEQTAVRAEALALKANVSDVPPAEVRLALAEAKEERQEIKEDLRELSRELERFMRLHATPRSRGGIGPDLVPPGEDD